MYVHASIISIETICSSHPQLSNHIRTECEFRLLQCRIPGCQTKVPAVRLEAHENLYCSSRAFIKRLQQIDRGRTSKTDGSAKYTRDWTSHAKIKHPKPGGNEYGSEEEDEDEEPQSQGEVDSGDR